MIGHISPSEECASHCWHLLHRYDVTSASGGTTSIANRCCQCGIMAHEKVLAQRDPDHGPYAPLVVNG